MGMLLFFLFGILALLIFNGACAESKRARVIAGFLTMGWSSLMFLGADWVETFNFNIWYSSAAHELLDQTIRQIEAGKADETAAELTAMRDRLSVTYENRGNFKELAEETAARLEKLSPNLKDDPSGE